MNKQLEKFKQELKTCKCRQRRAILRMFIEKLEKNS